MFYVDEADIDLNPKMGFLWTPKSQQWAILTPGANQKRYLAGALNADSGRVVSVESERKSSPLFISLLTMPRRTYRGCSKIVFILDNYIIHKSD